MSGAIGRAVAAAAGFVAGYVLVSVVGIAIAIAFASRAPGGDSTRALLEQFALIVYFFVAHGTLSAIVFAAIAALCRRWRQLGARAAALWGALAGMGGGAMYWIVYWIGLADVALKFFGATIGAGLASWIRPAIWIVTVLPGIVAGLAVVLWSIVARPPAAGAART